jgi:hypothetical protein
VENVHFHTLLLDGVYARDAQSGRLRWHRVGHPSTRTIEQLVVRIADRAEEWLAEQGYGTDEQEEPDPDDGQAVLQAAAGDGTCGDGQSPGAPGAKTAGAGQTTLPPSTSLRVM